MEPKFDTLRAIYEMIGETADPTKTLLATNELILQYLLKPFSLERFLRAINKASVLLEKQKVSDVTPHEKPGFFFAKANNKLNKVLYKNLLYIESIGNYVKIYTSEATFVNYNTMKSLESILPADQFVRIHNSYIVSLHTIKAVDGLTIELLSGKSLPVSKGRKDALYSALKINEP